MAAAARLLLYAGVALVIGAALLHRWRVFAVAGTTAGSLRPFLAASWGAIWIALATLLVMQSRDLEVTSWSALRELLTHTAWGTGFTVLAACVAAGTLAFSLRLREESGPLLAVALAFALGGVGHAAADDAWPWLSRLFDGVHVLGVGGWIGGLLLLARFAPHEHQRDAWESFSRRATIFAPLVLATGVGASLLRLRELSAGAALSSDYGRLLLLKSALAVAIVALGMLHRRQLARSAMPRGTSVRLELAFALIVLLATSVLTGIPPEGA